MDEVTNPDDFAALYSRRFNEEERRAKTRVWEVLCARFFPRYIDANATVLDIGAGHCEFINHVGAARRIAVDANPELGTFAAPGVEAHVAFAHELTFLAPSSVDVAFSSNFFEHLPSKEILRAVVGEVRRVLKPGGRFLVVGPNIRFLAGAYWDYYDHHLALTERSVAELLTTSGFAIDECLPKFLPYTVKSALPSWRILVEAYLLLAPVSYQLLGKQFFVASHKSA
jgi:SAM-dependent methyltransferase